MQEYIVYGETLPQAYHNSLLLLREAPVIPCPDWETTQKEVSMTMVVNKPLMDNMISRLFFGDPASLEQYRQEMLDGIFDFVIKDGKWSYTYHNRMAAYPIRTDHKIDYASQIGFVINELTRNPWSRRAVIDIRDNSQDMYNEDPACWQHAQFFIRDNNKLHMKVLFRSNDACKAAFMNAFALIQLQARIADTLGVEVGTYTHRANSYHCYERDFQMLDGYCNRIYEASSLEDVTYSYYNDWAEQMEEAKESIAHKVKVLSST